MRLECPWCNKQFTVSNDRAGAEDHCPMCGNSIMVPDPHTADARLAAPPQAGGDGGPTTPLGTGAAGGPPPPGGPPPLSGLANIPPMMPEIPPAVPRTPPQGSATGPAIGAVLGLLSLVSFLLRTIPEIGEGAFLISGGVGLLGVVISGMSLSANRPRRGLAICGLITGVTSMVVLAVAVISFVFSVPRSKELARRAICGHNLYTIDKGFGLYKADNDDSYPLIANKGAMRYDAPLRTADDVYALDGNASGDGTECNILQNLCLLVKTGVVSWKIFRCPQVGSELMPRGSAREYGFQWDEALKTNYCDYAYHIGYTNTVDGENAAPLRDAMDGGMPIVADRAPSAEDALADFYPTQRESGNRGKGWNHGSEGVQVLTAGGSVYWSDKTIKGGLSKNNIYLRDMSTAGDLIAPQGMKMPVKGTHSDKDSVLFWSQGK